MVPWPGPRGWSSAPYTLAVSRNLIRSAAVGCGLLAIAIRFYYVLQLELRLPFPVSFLAGVLATFLVPFGLLAVMLRYRRRAPLQIDAEQTRFVADRSPRRAFLGLLMFLVASGQIPFERVPNTDRMRPSTVPGMLPIGSVLFGLCLVAGLALIVINRPRLVLDRDGVLVEGLLRSERLAWTDTLAHSACLDQRKRWLYLQTAAQDPGQLKAVKLPVAWLDVDPILLQQAIRTYTDQPQRRDEIGTEAELERLTSETDVATHSRV